MLTVVDEAIHAARAFYYGSKGTDWGFVYVLESSESYYKIGKSKDVGRRIKQLGIQLPFKLTLAYAFYTPACSKIEELLHQGFSAKRLNGEWFNLDLDDFAEIHEVAHFTGFYERNDGQLALDPFFLLSDLPPQIEVEDLFYRRWPDVSEDDGQSLGT